MNYNIILIIYIICTLLLFEVFLNGAYLIKKFKISSFIIGRNHKFFLFIDVILWILVFLITDFLLSFYFQTSDKDNFIPLFQPYLNKHLLIKITDEVLYFLGFFCFSTFFFLLEFVYVAGYKYIKELVKDYFPNNSFFLLKIFFLFLFFLSIFSINIFIAALFESAII